MIILQNFIKRDINGNYHNIAGLHGDAYGIAWDGNVFWIGDYNGTFYGYTVSESEGYYSLELVGSFDAPEQGFNAITFDGSSFLVSLIFDEQNTVHRITYDGSVINSYEFENGFDVEVYGLHMDPFQSTFC